MSRRIFISYNYDDKEVAHTVRSFFQPDGGLCQGKAVSIVPTLERFSDAEVDERIKRTMQTCHIVLFVIGDTSHSRRWMAREVELAQSLRLVRGAVQLPDTTGGLPKRLADEGVKPLKWDQAELCGALNQFLQE